MTAPVFNDEQFLAEEEVIDLIIRMATGYYITKKLDNLIKYAQKREAVTRIYQQWYRENRAGINKLLRGYEWHDVLTSDMQTTLDKYAREWLRGNIVTIRPNAQQFIKNYGTLATLCHQTQKVKP